MGRKSDESDEGSGEGFGKLEEVRNGERDRRREG
jgi:hypothetical protein